MPALVVALFLAGQAASAQTPTEVDKLIIQPNTGFGGPVPTEQNIIRALNKLVLDEPDRVVCVPRQSTGSRRKLSQCATIEHWYDYNTGRNIPSKVARAGTSTADYNAFVNEARPPYELVDMITARYRDPKARERAAARVNAAAPPTSPAEPPVSNP